MTKPLTSGLGSALRSVLQSGVAALCRGLWKHGAGTTVAWCGGGCTVEGTRLATRRHKATEATGGWNGTAAAATLHAPSEPVYVSYMPIQSMYLPPGLRPVDHASVASRPGLAWPVGRNRMAGDRSAAADGVSASVGVVDSWIDH